MPRYIDPTEQLVTEILVADIKRSVRFYLELGFTLLRDSGMELKRKKGSGALPNSNEVRQAAGLHSTRFQVRLRPRSGTPTKPRTSSFLPPSSSLSRTG